MARWNPGWFSREDAMQPKRRAGAAEGLLYFGDQIRLADERVETGSQKGNGRASYERNRVVVGAISQPITVI